MPDSPAEDRIEMYWVYNPPDFFDEKIELPRADYTFEIEGGRATAKMSAAVYEPGKHLRQALTVELENYFRFWQLQTRKTFELRTGGVDRIHPDGTRESALLVRSVNFTLTVVDPNVVTVDPDGTVHDVRKEQFEARKKLAETQLVLSSDPDVRRMLESYDGSVTNPGEELVYLYEIWDAVMEKFKGGPAAERALGISHGTIDRFNELTCNLPLKQGRHRGRHDVLRSATTGELDEARKVALEIIDKYLKYIDGQRQQPSNP